MGQACCTESRTTATPIVEPCKVEPEQAASYSDEKPEVPEPVPDTPKEEEPSAKEVTLEVEFRTVQGDSTSVSFKRRPLGFNFANRNPIAVTKVVDRGHAQELGVQIGWQIKKVGGEPVDRPDFANDFKALTLYFNQQAKALPER